MVVDYTFPILVFFILMDVIALVVFSKIPLFIYVIGLFTSFVGVGLAVTAYEFSNSMGALCLFTTLMGVFTMLITALGYKVR